MKSSNSPWSALAVHAAEHIAEEGIKRYFSPAWERPLSAYDSSRPAVGGQGHSLSRAPMLRLRDSYVVGGGAKIRGRLSTFRKRTGKHWGSFVPKRWHRKGKISRGYTRRTGYYGRYGPAQQGEAKFFEHAISQSAMPNAGTVTDSINLVAQGVTETERVGRKCTVRYLQIRYLIRLMAATAAADSGSVARIIVFQDKQTNGVTANTTEILEQAHPRSFYNLANSGRFNILLDKLWCLSPQAAAATTTTTFTTMESVKCGLLTAHIDVPLEFSGTTGAITEVRSNNIGILFMSEDGRCELIYNARIRFTDN